MRKSIKNFVIGAVMAATALTASTAAFAGQFVQTDMNFRSGASKTCASIGSVPAGAEVEVLGSTNGWDLVQLRCKTAAGTAPAAERKQFHERLFRQQLDRNSGKHERERRREHMEDRQSQQWIPGTEK